MQLFRNLKLFFYFYFYFFTVERRHGETYRGSDTTQKNVQHPVFIKDLQMTAFCFYALCSVSCFFGTGVVCMISSLELLWMRLKHHPQSVYPRNFHGLLNTLWSPYWRIGITSKTLFLKQWN